MHTLTIKIQSGDKEFIKEILKTLAVINGNGIKVQNIETEHNQNNSKKEKIIKAIKEGATTEEIANRFGLTRGQAAAYKAHFTMGRYQ